MTTTIDLDQTAAHACRIAMDSCVRLDPGQARLGFASLPPEQAAWLDLDHGRRGLAVFCWRSGAVPVGAEDATMANELQWDGFASLADSGIREALFAAGVDCAMHGPCEDGYAAACFHEQSEHEPSFP